MYCPSENSFPSGGKCHDLSFLYVITNPHVASSGTSNVFPLAASPVVSETHRWHQLRHAHDHECEQMLLVTEYLFRLKKTLTDFWTSDCAPRKLL